MTLSVRLKQARIKKKLTQEELADIVGIKQQAVQRIEAGKVKSTSYVVQLAHALDVTPEWLVLGETAPEATSPQDANPTTFTAQIPLLQWHNIDALGNLPLDANHPSFIALLAGNANHCFALQIKDNSMFATEAGQPSFLKDDYIILDTQATAASGQYIVAKLVDSSQLTFRKLITDSNGQQMLQALNSQYNSIPMTANTKLCGVLTLRYSNFLG
jgi:SOS-response transcriptional repressor LexA